MKKAAGYAAAIVYMLRAQRWTRRSGAADWTRLQAIWGEAESDPRFAGNTPLAAADVVRLVASGEEGFALRDALYRDAARTIDIATYYVQADDTGRATMRALAASAARGVRVRLLVDRVMTARKTAEVEGMDALLAEAAAAGILLRQWHDPSRPYDSNHRKLMVVDGRTAIVGGRNFADHYRGDAWRDADLVLEGTPVAPLADLFESIWIGAAMAGDPLRGSPPWVDYMPEEIESDAIMRGVLSAVGAERHSVDLELAYFVSHDALCGALARASARGVRVRLLTNSAESNDLPYAAWAAYDGARRVLEAGGTVHARRGADRTLHCKYVVVDGEWASFGSHNLDYYSSRYCCETNLVVRDARLGALLTGFFETGLADATPLSLDDEVRPFLRRHLASRIFDRVFGDFQ